MNADSFFTAATVLATAGLASMSGFSSCSLGFGYDGFATMRLGDATSVVGRLHAYSTLA